ncbi:alpha/beta fold hydrolase [Patescibacteria group bacterium]
MIPQKSIKIEGTKHKYSHAGKGKPVILLPGLGATYQTWDKTFSYLSRHYQVYSISLPIYGTRNKTGDAYNLDNLHKFLGLFINKVGIEKPSLIGHSLGGLVSLSYVTNNPKGVNKLILVASPLSNQKKKPSLLLKGVVSFALSKKSEALTKFLLKRKNLTKSLTKLVFSGDGVPDFNEIFSYIPAKNYALGVQDLLTKNYKEEISKVNIPTLIIYGNNDKALHILNGTSYYDNFSKGKIITLNDNHFIQTNSPKKLAGIIAEFLEEGL